MAVTQPFVTAWRNGLFGNNDGPVSGVSLFSTNWLDARKVRILSVNVSWTAFAATAGTVSVQGTEDPSASVLSAVTLTPSQVNGAQPTGGTAGALLLFYEFVPSFVRIQYTPSGGGTTNQFSVFAMGRAV